jgi:hypothetical protein
MVGGRNLAAKLALFKAGLGAQAPRNSVEFGHGWHNR